MDRRAQVLAAVRSAPTPLSIVEVADELGVHPNTARFHLDVLERKGRVERVARTGSTPGRPALRFRARRTMDPDGPRNYELLAGVLADGLGHGRAAERRAVESGRAWGHRLVAGVAPSGGEAAAEELVEVLDHLGFSPVRRHEHGAQQIALRHCPFLELVDRRSDVICPVHLGLMQGVVERLTDDVTVEALDPFVEPDLCVAHLGFQREEGLS